jgi:hypothetical protein
MIRDQGLARGMGGVRAAMVSPAGIGQRFAAAMSRIPRSGPSGPITYTGGLTPSEELSAAMSRLRGRVSGAASRAGQKVGAGISAQRQRFAAARNFARRRRSMVPGSVVGY